jgi:hypothetical protein
MRAKLWLQLGVLSLLVTVLPVSSHALSGLTIVINGANQNVLSTATSFDLTPDGTQSKTYGCLSITSADGVKTAKITTDEPSDALVLQNALMKPAPGFSICNATISYWAMFDAPPSTSTSAQKYQRVAKGTLLKNATTSAINTWISVEAFLDGKSIGGPVTKNVTCLPPASACGGNFNLAVNSTFSQGSVGDPHEIQYNMSFGLKTSLDKLTFAGADDAHTLNIGLGGGDGEDPSIEHVYKSGEGDGCTKCCQVCPEGVKGQDHKDGKNKDNKHDTKEKSHQ